MIVHLSELLLGVLYAQADCVFYLCVSEQQVCYFVSESLGTGCVGRVGTIKDPPFPVFKAGHSVSYSCVCDVCLEWVNEGGSFYSSLKSLFG